MDTLLDNIKNFTVKNSRTVTFVNGDDKIVFPIWKIKDDSTLFKNMFEDVTQANFDVDLNNIKNVSPELFIQYLAALLGKHELTLDECYKLYPWVESELVYDCIGDRLHRAIKDKKESILLNFIEFIICDKSRMNENITAFYHDLHAIAESVSLTWSQLEKCSPEICIFVMELYYCYFSTLSAGYCRANGAKLTTAWIEKQECRAYPGKIFTAAITRLEYMDIYKHYRHMFGVDTIAVNTVADHFWLSKTHQSLVPVLDRFRSMLIY